MARQELKHIILRSGELHIVMAQRMVMERMQFTREVRTGNWALHLQSLETFTNYFFAHDMINYPRMVPVYSVDMQMLSKSDPEVYEEFQQGNRGLKKNSRLPFCATEVFLVFSFTHSYDSDGDLERVPWSTNFQVRLQARSLVM